MRVLPLLVLLLPPLAAGPRLAAQGMVRGVISDAASGRGVGPAVITLLALETGATRQTISTDSGSYFFADVAAGRYRVGVQLLGYAPALSLPLLLSPADTLDIPVQLTASALTLDSLLVEGRARPGGLQLTLENFHVRRQRATGGIFITREQIEARAASQLWDVVRSQARTDRSLRNLMARRPPCQLEVFVDGWSARLGTGEPLEDFLNRFSPKDIEGIEIYRNMSALPAELATPRAQECGVIAIWTRRGR